MRSVRSLSSIAGPGASLAQAGGSVLGAVNPALAMDYVPGTYGDTDVSIDVSSWGIEAGDLLIACLFTAAWFGNDAGGLHGKTEITQAGWTEIYLHSHLARIVYKIADGSETLVTASAVTHGGMSLIALRGVRLPDAFTSTNLGQIDVGYVTNQDGRPQTIPAFGGTVGVDFDLLMTFAISTTYGVFVYSGHHSSADTEVLAVYTSSANLANTTMALRGGGNPDVAWWAATSSDHFQGIHAYHIGLFKD